MKNKTSCKMLYTITEKFFEKKNFFPLYLFFTTLSVYFCCFRFFYKFPNDYNWGELFINYQGGFVRRGLVGEFLFIINDYIPVRIFALIFFSIVFYYFLYICYKKLSTVFDGITTAFLFITPTLFLFHVRDPEAFMRKDLLVEIILLFMMERCATFLKNDDVRWSLVPLTAFFCGLYAVAFLIHEMTLFYLPLPALLLGAAYARRGKLPVWLGLMSALVIFSLLTAFWSSGSTAAREAICASWQHDYPTFNCQGGVKHIGKDLATNTLNTLRHHQNLVTMLSFVGGFLLSAIPMVFVWMAYPPRDCLRKVLASPLLLFLFWPAVCVPLTLPLFLTDFGRHISVAFLEYIFFLYAVFTVCPQSPAPWLQKLSNGIRNSLQYRFLAILWIIGYGMCWRMMHYEYIGNSYVHADGPLKLLLSLW